MTNHDPLCPGTGPTAPFPFPVCVCAIIAEVRADERAKVLAEYGLESDREQVRGAERERIARAIEAMDRIEDPDDLIFDAARIARTGGAE